MSPVFVNHVCIAVQFISSFWQLVINVTTFARKITHRNILHCFYYQWTNSSSTVSAIFKNTRKVSFMTSIQFTVPVALVLNKIWLFGIFFKKLSYIVMSQEGFSSSNAMQKASKPVGRCESSCIGGKVQCQWFYTQRFLTLYFDRLYNLIDGYVSTTILIKTASWYSKCVSNNLI